MKLFPAGKYSDFKKEFNKYCEVYFDTCSKWKKIRILADVIKCYFRYGSWTNNYFEYRFWEKSANYRNTFLTWKRARKFINNVNGTKHSPIFREKHLFLQSFSEYIYRDWVFVGDVSYERFEQFLHANPVFMEKNDSGMFGIGVTKKRTEDINNYKEYYEYARQNRFLLEECIDECETLQVVHTKSLNTIRVMTFLKKNAEVVILGAVFRMGNNGSVVDNARADGLFAAIDLESGIVTSQAVNFWGDKYVLHPFSREKIVGLEVPAWDNVKKVCMEAAQKQPQVRLVGWDVVVREENGKYQVELIEGNDRPGVPTLQVPEQCGLYEKVREL